MPGNYAFIDSQNVHRGMQRAGWALDWRKFREHLQHHYGVTRAYIFIGYVQANESLYHNLQAAGFFMKYKNVTYQNDGKPKGNVDAELVLQAMIDFMENNYEKAVIVTSDGDFACLVQYLYEKGRLLRVLSPTREKCSALLKRAAKEKIGYLEEARRRLEYKKI